MPDYLLYGVRLRANRPLPGLVPAAETPATGVEVVLAGQDADAVPFAGARWSPLSTVPQVEDAIFKAWKTVGDDPPAFRLQYRYLGEQAVFTIGPAGRALWVTWSPGVPMEDLMSVLVGQVMGCVLRLRGVTCLHAAVLDTGGQAILLLGHRGAGKSTTAAALRRMGCRFVADDVAALTPANRRFGVYPGPPRMRLRRSAADHLTGDAGVLQPVWVGEGRPEKWHLDVSTDLTALGPQALPVAAAYVLAPRRPAHAGVEITPVCGAAALPGLFEHTYVDFISEASGRAHDFSTLGRLAASVPLRRVSRPDGLDALPAICSAILDDFSAVSPNPAPLNHHA